MLVKGKHKVSVRKIIDGLGECYDFERFRPSLIVILDSCVKFECLIAKV